MLLHVGESFSAYLSEYTCTAFVISSHMVLLSCGGIIHASTTFPLETCSSGIGACFEICLTHREADYRPQASSEALYGMNVF